MIQLHEQDLEIITEALILVTEYKAVALSAKKFNIFNTYWLPEAIAQIEKNNFKLNHPKKNVFIWIIDQINHCNLLSQGVKPEYGYPLSKTKTGEAAISICEKAARGKSAYLAATRGENNFTKLFD